MFLLQLLFLIFPLFTTTIFAFETREFTGDVPYKDTKIITSKPIHLVIKPEHRNHFVNPTRKIIAQMPFNGFIVYFHSLNFTCNQGILKINSPNLQPQFCIDDDANNKNTTSLPSYKYVEFVNTTVLDISLRVLKKDLSISLNMTFIPVTSHPCSSNQTLSLNSCISKNTCLKMPTKFQLELCGILSDKGTTYHITINIPYIQTKYLCGIKRNKEI